MRPEARYRFFVNRRDRRYRLVLAETGGWPEQTREADWEHARTREASDTAPDVVEAVARGGYCLFVIGLDLADLPDSAGRPEPAR